MMRRLAAASLAVALTLATAGCTDSSNSKAHPSTTQPSTTRRSTTTTPDTDDPNAMFTKGWPDGSGGACGDHSPGAAHVLMTFCNGPATVTVTIDGTPHEIKGVCWINGPKLEIDAGTAPGAGFEGTWPDYVTTQVPTQSGTSVGSVLSATIGGVRRQAGYAFTTIVAGTSEGTTVDADMIRTTKVTGTVKGIPATGDDDVSATFDCGGPAAG